MKVVGVGRGGAEVSAGVVEVGFVGVERAES